ncbi:unnamed protein product [Ambrosiozyma monospora]|uniref:Unnamed protein product n=1 Tax=Ambrosiozyma monospora TaxID=43982 RepID=A0ACB5TD99_AMBMO|nr:unnamed protein product [Ambrosiozyma monospora]
MHSTYIQLMFTMRKKIKPETIKDAFEKSSVGKDVRTLENQKKIIATFGTYDTFLESKVNTEEDTMAPINEYLKKHNLEKVSNIVDWEDVVEEIVNDAQIARELADAAELVDQSMVSDDSYSFSSEALF